MPRGVPAAGFRMTKNRKHALGITSGHVPLTMEQIRAAVTGIEIEPEVDTQETDEEIRNKLEERFDVVGELTHAAVDGDISALIVSGPAGVGKSYTVEKILKEANAKYQIVRGYVRPTGLYKLLYANSAPDSVLVFDDADSIFYDDVSLNMLKAVCDTTERREVSYRSETVLVDDDTGESLPKWFEFQGTIIFITNLDFDALVERGHKLAPHLQALVSRSHYIDLAMKSRRDYMVRINQVVEAGMLADLDADTKAAVMQFVEDNAANLRELSLRIVIKVADIAKSGRANWQSVAKITCCRSGGKARD